LIEGCDYGGQGQAGLIESRAIEGSVSQPGVMACFAMENRRECDKGQQTEFGHKQLL